ncbi:hypothetical protein [Shewanella algae]|nr:hypothetical protein [Shewanella algae]MBC8795055.1 hypothetical protein [Shewanella algae]UZD57912.1 hypothetical protein OLL83_003743 [Shewanella algae]
MKITTIGLDIAKLVFHAVAVKSQDTHNTFAEEYTNPARSGRRALLKMA